MYSYLPFGTLSGPTRLRVPLGRVTLFSQPRNDLLFVNEVVGLLFERFIWYILFYGKKEKGKKSKEKIKGKENYYFIYDCKNMIYKHLV